MPPQSQSKGKWTRELLDTRLRQQCVIAGDAGLAKAVASAVTLNDIRDKAIFLHAGDPSAAMHFILEGTVEIRIKGTLVAIRKPGDLIGEVALLANSPRIADAVARGDVVTATLVAEKAVRIGKSFPAFWANIAGQLAKRLSERSDQIREANPTPIIFLGSSSEDCDILQHTAICLRNSGFISMAWNDPFTFRPGGTTIDELLENARKADFAILILSANDFLSSRGKRNQPAPRDNVIFESGLFMGNLGRERTILMCEPQLKIPSDLWGLVSIEFDRIAFVNSKATIAPAIEKVTHHITRLGAR